MANIPPTDLPSEGATSPRSDPSGMAPSQIWFRGRLVSSDEYFRTSRDAPVGQKPILPTTFERVESSDSDRVYPVIVPDRNQARSQTLISDHASIPGVLEDCGLEDKFSKRLVVCSFDIGHDHYETGGTSCGKPGCPRHWKTWARRGADRIGRVLAGYRDASKGRQHPRHTILSISDEDPIVKKRAGKTDRENLRFFRRYFIDRAIFLGGRGGSLCIHLWRTNDLVPENIGGSRRWDWVRNRSDWRNYVKFSPHAHVIGFGFYKRCGKGDFLYKNMAALKDRDAVESVAYYQLSHAPIGVGNAVVYWGCCSPERLQISKNFKGKSDTWVSSEPVHCSKCGAPVIYSDGGDQYFRRRSYAVYTIVPKSEIKKKPPKGSTVSNRSSEIWGSSGAPNGR